MKTHAPWLYTFWQFSRPHTVIGTSLSVLGLYGVAVALGSATPLSPAGQPLGALIGTWIACLCANIYIVGLNQLEDIAIDRINKPHLPLAAGTFSRRTGQRIVAITGILSLVLAGLLGPFLLVTVSVSVAIGTAYSLPPIRLKRFPFWAALCIFGVRGAIVNLGFYLHFSWLLGAPSQIPPAVWTLTVFILLFTFAIAIFKDIPDLEGDRQFNITTFTIRLGTQAVFNLARWVLTVAYLGVVLAAFRLSTVNTAFLVVTHLTVLAGLWWCSGRVDRKDKSAIARFYQFIWKLFYLEYILFPIACLL